MEKSIGKGLRGILNIWFGVGGGRSILEHQEEKGSEWK